MIAEPLETSWGFACYLFGFPYQREAIDLGKESYWLTH